MNWQFLAAKNMCIESEIIHGEKKKNGFLSNCNRQWTIGSVTPFVGDTLYELFLLAHIPNCYRWNQIIIYSFHPTEIASTWDFFTKHLIPQRRNYSCVKTSMHQPTGTFHTLPPNLSRSVMKIKMILPANYSQYHGVYIPNINVFVFFHIHELYIFARTMPDFRRSVRTAWIAIFLIPFTLLFRFTLYI
jgi:hypothetical protein